MSSLLVYKASAGSGKTFTLAVEYIKLLIQNPVAYRNILAVTFTNKATGEMKERILSQLYGIATGDKDSKAYLQKICDELEMSAEAVRERAAEALTKLIHDYSRFQVTTIDSFFQTVMRNLARELGLGASMNIELDTSGVLDNAVDTLVERLDIHSPIFAHLLDYIKELIAEDKTWEVIASIKKFGRDIFREEFMEQRNTLHTKKDYVVVARNEYQYGIQRLAREIRAGDKFPELTDEDIKNVLKFSDERYLTGHACINETSIMLSLEPELVDLTRADVVDGHDRHKTDHLTRKPYSIDGGVGFWLIDHPDSFEGELKECDEGNLEWVSREFLNDLPKWEGDQIFLDLMWQEEPFFLLTLRYSGDKLVENRTLKEWRTHNGIDLQAQNGDMVKAACDGKVTAITFDPLWGTTVEVQSNEHTLTYCGLSEELNIKLNDHIKLGDNIGTIGEIPCEAAEGLHLHFTVQHNNEYIDPFSLLSE